MVALKRKKLGFMALNNIIALIAYLLYNCFFYCMDKPYEIYSNYNLKKSS